MLQFLLREGKSGDLHSSKSTRKLQSSVTALLKGIVTEGSENCHRRACLLRAVSFCGLEVSNACVPIRVAQACPEQSRTPFSPVPASSFLRKQAPARVPVPHECHTSLFVSAYSYSFVFTPLGCGATSSYSALEMPSRYLSNQPTMCSSRSTRCHGWPERESSCDSPGNRTMMTGRFRNFSARNISSPPEPGGVR